VITAARIVSTFPILEDPRWNPLTATRSVSFFVEPFVARYVPPHAEDERARPAQRYAARVFAGFCRGKAAINTCILLSFIPFFHWGRDLEQA